MLAALGRFDEDEVARLEAFSRHLQSALGRLRYVDYAQAERDCAALAERLVGRFGRDALRAFRFVGLPRGGLLVLGMLSYVLDLDHDRLEGPLPDDAPLVVVDDCALTGSRFHRFLQQHPERDVVFAPLYAHPDLRRAIEREAPNVIACVSARDLHDHAPDALGDAYEAWQRRWEARDTGPRYWIGQPDHVCFPWNEPDIGVWNPATQQVEPGPRVVPPDRCLKNRHRTREAEPPVPVQVQPEAAGPIRPHPAVLFGTLDDSTIVANPGADVCVELDGTAAAMWHALVAHGAVAGALDALRATYDVDADRLRADLEGFIEALVARDLLSIPDAAHV